MNSELGKQEQGKRGFLEVISKLSSEEKNKLTGMCVWGLMLEIEGGDTKIYTGLKLATVDLQDSGANQA